MNTIADTFMEYLGSLKTTGLIKHGNPKQDE